MKSINKRSSLLIVLAIYIIAILASFYIVSFLNPSTTIKQVLFIDIIATLIVYLFSLVFKNASIYDPYWSVIPPIIAGYLIWQNPEGNLMRQIIVFGIIMFWSVRLTVNWARGWNDLSHQDWRYTKLANDTGWFYWIVNLTGIQMFPTLLVFLGCLPLFYLLPATQKFAPLEIVAIFVAISAVLIEWIADEQLKTFKKDTLQKIYIDTGLWSISRHPNYLGEITFWLGLFLFVPFSGITDSAFYTILGTIAMILLFRFISIPMMEKRNMSRKEGYKDYIMKVPMLFPIKIRKANK